MVISRIILFVLCILANAFYLYIGIVANLIQEKQSRRVLTVISTVGGLLVMVMDVDFWIFMSKSGRSGVLLNSAAILIGIMVISLMIFNLVCFYRFNLSFTSRK